MMQKNKRTKNFREEINQSRRSALRKIAAGTAALAGCSVLPDKWSTPLAEFGTLPAHATTSGIEELIELVEDRYEEAVAEEAVQENAEPSQETAASAEASETTAPVQTENNDDLRGFSNKLTIQDSGQVMFCDGILQHKIVFPKLGPQYGPALLLVWSDGNELSVPDSSRMAMNANQDDYRKYQPGGVYSDNNPDIPTMEVYAKRGTHPSSVTLYC